jgi:hypothetical protein
MIPARHQALLKIKDVLDWPLAGRQTRTRGGQ